MTLHSSKPARDGGKMWSESDTVRFLEEWMRLSKEHPESTRTEKTQMIRPMFMNRSDRSVTSKIDLELKRLRGEQSDPYPRLNPLRERVYGMKAVERPHNTDAVDDDEADEEEVEEEEEEDDDSSTEDTKSTHQEDYEEEGEDESVEDKDDEDYRDNENSDRNQNRMPKGGNKDEEDGEEDNHKMIRRTKRIKAVAAAKRHQKRLRKIRLETRSRVKRLLAIGTDMTEEPSRAWLGDRVYTELQAVESLFRQLKEEQCLLVEYSRSVAGELRLVKQWLEL